MQSCEDLEDEESLRHLFSIMRSAIMLNDTSLLEALLAEDAVMVSPTPPPAHGWVAADTLAPHRGRP